MKALTIIVSLLVSLLASTSSAADSNQQTTLIRKDNIFVSVELECLGTVTPAPIFNNSLRMAQEQCAQLKLVHNQILKTLLASGLRPIAGDEGLSQSMRSDIAFQVKVVTNAMTTVFVNCYTPHPGYGFEVRDEIRAEDIERKLSWTMDKLYADARNVSLGLVRSGKNQVIIGDSKPLNVHNYLMMYPLPTGPDSIPHFPAH